MSDAGKPFNILIIAQNGRLMYEALLFAASLRRFSPSFSGSLYIGMPQDSPLWERNPVVRNKEVLALFDRLQASILPFKNKHFGQAYPYGNKIEALQHLPENEPFVFFDSDTLVTSDLMQVPFDFARPSASLRREGTWPKPTLYGPGYEGIWGALYQKFALDFPSSQDRSEPVEHWRRYLYFNAGYFYGACPHAFGQRFQDYALAIRDDTPEALVGQSLDPWLDQIALPLVIHALGGGADTLPPGYLDGQTTCHYRTFPLLYARESQRTIEALEEVCAPNWLKKVLKSYEPIKRMVYQGRGHKVRALFDQDNMPRKEQAIRNRIKSAGYWMR